jgi:light-regulated signal transduction histidine kinase (bacteriophytochrome)
MIQDITDSKHAEAALKDKTDALERSNRDLEQFAYVAAHDLREPLVGVAAYLKLLERRIGEAADRESKKYLSRALDTVLRMDLLIRSLLTYSRLSEKDQKCEPTDCNACLTKAMANLSSTIKASKATVTADQLPSVMGVPVHITQVFQNLIGNAIKFRGEAPVRIHIGVEEQGAQHCLWVQDNGLGIEAPHFDRIFQIFQRVEKSTHPQGTGIGLATCKKIVERHGGRIWVESEPGKGSTFYFTLPKK